MKGHSIPYSAAEMAWLKRNRRLVISDYHSRFCAAFQRLDVSAVNLHSLRKRKGWSTGRTGCFAKGSVPHNKGKPHPGAHHPNAQRTQFKRGQLPHNTNYAGHERVTKDGYVEISVEERNPYTGFERRYVLKHRHLWEKLHGPVPDGMALKCKGERTNCDPTNWELIPRALLPRLAGGRHQKHVPYDTAPDDLKPAILAVAKLEHRVRQRRAA